MLSRMSAHGSPWPQGPGGTGNGQEGKARGPAAAVPKEEAVPRGAPARQACPRRAFVSRAFVIRAGTGALVASVLAVAGLLATGAAQAVAGEPGSAGRAGAGEAARPPVAVASGCPANLADELRSTDGASQLVTVEAAVATDVTATVALWQRSGRCWARAAGPWPGFIGRNGFSGHHREGDGTTPTGTYAIGPVAYGNAPNPGTRLLYHRLVCGDWWDEDPTSPAYNRFQHLPCGQAPPFGGDSEALWTETAAYPAFAVIEYNTHPVVAYAGSAIFVHATTGVPTAGCVAVPLEDLDALLRWLRPAAHPHIVMGPAAEIRRF